MTESSDPMHAQFADDWKYWMQQYPEVATALGYPGQNMRWTDYSQSAIQARAAYLRNSLNRLNGIGREQLQPENQLNYVLYRDLLETAIQGLEFHNDALPIRGVVPHSLRMPVNQMEGTRGGAPDAASIMLARNIMSR